MAADHEWSVHITGFPHTEPGLMGAKRRLERAVAHHQELVEIVEEFEDMNFGTIKVRMDLEPDPDSDEEDLEADWSGTTAPPMSKVAIIAGELAYNVRAALDYTVYALAWHDAGEEVEMTQFPLDERERDFHRHRDSWLKGLSDEHVGIIREYQPFVGCAWARTLKHVSNPDKHKKLTLVTPKWIANFDTDKENWDPVPGEPGRVERVVPDMELNIMLLETMPVLETSRSLLYGAAEVVRRFEPLYPKEWRFSLGDAE